MDKIFSTIVPAHFKDPSSWLTISLLHIHTTQKTTGTRL